MRLNSSLAVIAFAFIACSEKKDTYNKPNQLPPIVDVMIAEKRGLTSELELNGSILSNEFVELMPETNGRLVYLNVPEGKVVQAGTVIARINDADLQAQLKKTQVQLEIAELTEQRLAKLLAVNGVNQADYDMALNQVNSLKADLDITQALIDKTVIKAPFTGRVGLRQVSNGAYVTTSTVIATMQETSQLKVDFNVPEEYSEYLKIGTVVDVVVDKRGTGDNERVTARIIAIEPQVDISSRNIVVRAMLSKTDASPGSFAKVYLKLGEMRKSIQIPTNSIIPEAKSKKVIRVKSGKAESVAIETGVRQSSMVEVLSGIDEGDTIVVSGVLFARPGRAVEIREIKSPQALMEAASN